MKYLFIASFFFLIGCNGNVVVTPGPDSVNNDGTLLNDTTTMTLDTFKKSTKTPNGFYGVMLPCPDCKGIEHTVLFRPDLTFRMEENKWGKRQAFTKAEGRWKAIDGKIFLYKNDTVKARYTWQGDTLYYVQPDDRSFAMRQLTAAAENPTWQKKGEAGVEFFGVGNEPFWSVEVDEQKRVSFHLAEWQAPQTFKAKAPVTKGDSTVYSAKSDSASLRVTVFSTFCSDGMSNFIYTNKVRIVYNGQVYQGCGILFKELSSR